MYLFFVGCFGVLFVLISVVKDEFTLIIHVYVRRETLFNVKSFDATHVYYVSDGLWKRTRRLQETRQTNIDFVVI